MWIGIRIHKLAQSPFVGEVDLTPTNDTNTVEDNNNNNTPADKEADGWDYNEYEEYIAKLGDDIEGVDE